MKKNILLVVTLVVLVACLVACNSTGVAEPAASETASSSEVISEEVSSEEVSEEASSEEVVITYSAEEVMKHIDELTAEYQYNNPEHIKSLVIAANLDYITAEDLDTLLTVYGYSMDDLAALYDEFLVSNSDAFDKSLMRSQGQLDELLPEETYENRIRMQDVMIDPTTAEFCVEYDEMLINRSNGVPIEETQQKVCDFIDNLPADVKISNFDNFVYGYTLGMWQGLETAEMFFVNPYAHYQNAN